jgi:hypothetical protein|nr:CehA/McbA family metallohydrolase [Kofleriaceae bacterium]
MRRIALLALVVAACGNDHGVSSDAPTACPLTPFAEGSLTGHPDPLHAAATEARAGRIHAADLPAVPSGLVTWHDNDFVLANSKVALVIEDVGDSDLYDPWGGRPVGLAAMSNGALVQPDNFGEFFLLVGRSTPVTDSVTVLADGSTGGPAIIRAHGKLSPLPFYESIVGPIFSDPYDDMDAVIDYSLAPGAEAVDITIRIASPRPRDTVIPSTMHALMYTKRTPVYQPNRGFSENLGESYLALVDDHATSWAYLPADGPFHGSVATSGFVGSFTAGVTVPACGEVDHAHAQLVIGGPGLDGIVAAVDRTCAPPSGDAARPGVAGPCGDTQQYASRTVTGTVTRGGAPAAGVRVHATDAAGDYLTRASTGSDGSFALTVPAAADVSLTTFSRGDAQGSAHVGTATAADAIALPATGTIHVDATDGGVPAPVRVQVVPAAGQIIPTVPDYFGEPAIAANRLHVAFATTGSIDLPAPPGDWQVIVSRGYEYELVTQTVTVTAGATATVTAPLVRSVDTTGSLCGDFHVHTWRSNDSGDDSLQKVAQAVSDGVELPVRSDHEWVADFSAEIAQLGVGAWASALGSVELTSFQVWGHMGVFPLVPDPNGVNAGAPRWQTFPTAASPDTPFVTMSPTAVFQAVRARPEAPVIIINHPHGPVNYFPYVGYDAATGIPTDTADWDTKFTLVEVFNNSSWTENRSGTVADWFGLLHAGRQVFATGSSDSHQLSTSPVGYPRTCVAVGTDDPRAATGPMVRDALAAGHAHVFGGIYVDAKLGTAGGGDTTTGAGSLQMVDVTVQAASWVDVTSLDVVVDGQTVDTIPIMPGDADPTNPVVRYHAQVPVTVQATGGFIVIAAYGGKALEPVHPGLLPFGVAEPIFVTP